MVASADGFEMERRQIWSVRKDALARRVRAHLLHLGQHLGPRRVEMYTGNLLGATCGNGIREPARARHESTKRIASGDGWVGHVDSVIGLHRE